MPRYNPDHHHRHSIRLQNYDYSQQGAYFITICTHQRGYLFGSIDAAVMTLNAQGKIARACWNDIPTHFPHADIDALVVMPNHLHGIVVIQDNPSVGARYIAPERQFGPLPRGSLHTIIGTFKAAVTRRINQLGAVAGSPVWQRNYHEHIIRDEKSLNLLREYIANNPALWEQDRLFGTENA